MDERPDREAGAPIAVRDLAALAILLIGLLVAMVGLALIA